jgi:Domain of unknown function (DUF4129)
LGKITPQMDKQRLVKTFLLSGFTLLALILLAAGLDKILYSPVIIPTDSQTTIESFGNIKTISFQGNQAVFYLLFILLLLAFLSLFLTSEGRKRLGLVVIILILMLAAVYLTGTRKEKPIIVSEDLALATPQNQIEIVPTNLPLIQADNIEPEPPGWAVTLAGIGLAVLFTVGAALFIRYLTHKQAEAPTMQAIAEEAANTLEAIEAGEDFEDVILACYAKMTQIVSRDRGYIREAAKTPREFESSLTKLGFPNEPVHNLTHLFEQVRYGHIPTSAEGIQIAINSLNAIITFCQPPALGLANE